jgi:serine/threonine protein kinase
MAWQTAPGSAGQARHMTCMPAAHRVPASLPPVRRIGYRAMAIASNGPVPTQRTGREHDGKSLRLIAGRYRLQSLLGKGGMGTVWRAWDELLLRTVALKEFTVPESVVDRTRANARVLCEAQAASQVSHPSVVRVYDVATEDGRPWIVMEALSGPTLAHELQWGGRLSVERVVEVGLQMLEGLRAIHAAGVTHRDLKPRNVQSTEPNRVVITDFGVAAPSDSGPAVLAGQVYGSPPYIAPEVIVSSRFGPASDLFSLGATLYAAVEGYEPFKDATPFDTLMAVLQRPPRPIQHAGPLRSVIEGLLVKDPDERMVLDDAHARLKQVGSDLAGR